jgi:hypothetical protein
MVNVVTSSMAGWSAQIDSLLDFAREVYKIIPKLTYSLLVFVISSRLVQ